MCRISVRERKRERVMKNKKACVPAVGCTSNEVRVLWNDACHVMWKVLFVRGVVYFRGCMDGCNCSKSKFDLWLI